MTRTDDKRLSPAIRWPGGKRRLLPILLETLPSGFNRYIEPFLGSGALFFAIEHKKALLADLNEDLINFYKVLKKDPHGLINGLGRFPNRKNVYYRLRATAPVSSFDRAVRFLYLNRTCFNGLYRTNTLGTFNVPYGDNSRSVLGNVKVLGDCAASLKHVKLSCQDFELTCAAARPGDLVFCDPPYTVAHNKNSFIKYNAKLFTWEDQVRLRDTLVQLSKKKVHILLTNAAHRSVLRLYRNFSIKIVTRKSLLSADSDSRCTVHEAIITNY